MEGQQREASREMGPMRLGLLRARTSMLGSRLDPEWSQDGPFIDPWDTTQVVGDRTPAGGLLLLQHLLKTPPPRPAVRAG